jgi:hypothetical protein
MSGDRQASADWFDNVDDADGEPLERILADSGQAKELMREAYFRCALRSLSRRRSLPEAAPSRIAWRPWRLAIAALLCLAAGVWVLLALQSASEQPTLDGRRLADGQRLEADGGPLYLRWRDDTRIELAAGGALRIGSGAGRQLALERGVLQAEVAVRSDVLTIDADGCIAAATTGAAFACQRTPEAVWLSVTRGTVALARDQGGFQATLPAGGACVLPRHGLPHVEQQAVAIKMLHDSDQPAAVVTVEHSPGDSARLGREPGIRGGTASQVIGSFVGDPPVDMVGDVHHCILLHVAARPAVWDLSRSDGLEFWFRGPADGGRLWIEVISADAGPASGNDEQTHFTAIVPQIAPGWQLVRLPWSAFTIREWPARPPGTPLRRETVWNCNFMLLGVKHPDFAVDRLAAWTAP